MKVRKLQEELGKLDPDVEVVCYSEDEKLLVEGRGLIVLDILAVNTVKGEQLRLDDGTPYLKFGTDAGATIATLEVTSDF